MEGLLSDVIDIAVKAGDVIIEIYQKDFNEYKKSDGSPLTEADIAAHNIIVNGLSSIGNLPILSEESVASDVSWDKRQSWSEFWLIDPLDGTKEFINKNDEFTVNIALVRGGKAVMGVVYCPALNRCYYATSSTGAFRQDGEGKPQRLSVSQRPEVGNPWIVVGSRRHGSSALEEFSTLLGSVELVSMGSSLKLCMVAEGKAHLYPRLAPTCEWDTAAAQAVVEAAGGQVLTAGLKPLIYGKKENLLNPYFIVCKKSDDAWWEAFSAAASNELVNKVIDSNSVENDFRKL